MKRILLVAFVSAFTLGAMASCNRGDLGAYVDIDSTIDIRLSHQKTLQFYCQTEQIYPYGNYSIDIENQQTSNSIDISFKRVIVPNIGMGRESPASAIIDLGTLSNGVYNLNLSVGETARTVELTVSSDGYTVNIEDSSIFNFTNTPFNKTPEHTIWGTMGWYYEQETSTQFEAFINALINLGAEERAYIPGYYIGFTIDENGDIVQPSDNPVYWFARSFILNYSGNIANVEQLIGQYTDYKSYMSVRLYTDKGEDFLSWIY